MNTTDNQKAINDFIDWVVEISECVNSNEWRGEDVMGIFFNEFNRYKKKSEAGQVFTPEHITDFMYKILDANMDDCVSGRHMWFWRLPRKGHGEYDPRGRGHGDERCSWRD